MFETDKFIREVEKKKCLWNKNHQNYGDASVKRNSWHEIGVVIYDDWITLRPSEKDERVQQMFKKWRHIRDYYKKEKKRCDKEKEMGKPNSNMKRKRRYNYFSCLTFLDNNDDVPPSDNQDYITPRNYDDDSESSNNDEQVQEEEDEVEEEIQIKEEPLSAKRKKDPVTTFQTRLLTTQNPLQDDASHSTSVKNFLQSLVPDVQTLNEQQYMSFRLGVLNLINNIKFGSADGMNESWVVSTMGDNLN